MDGQDGSDGARRDRMAGLVQALARRNRLEAPRVVRVGLEVRTSIGFTLKPEDQARQILDDRKGLDPFQVDWEFHVPPDDLNDFRAAILENEPDLLAKSAGGPVRYLGTWLIQEQAGDPPLFVTSWGCASAADALSVATGPWNGPAGAEDLYRYTFVGYFDHSKAQRITSRGLAAAASL